MRGTLCAALAAVILTAATPGLAADWRLPFSPGASINLSQDCNDSCCDDHVGPQKWAYDFANGTHFNVRAAREGTVVHLKQSSNKGGVGSSFAKYANYVVLDHGDGHISLYWHLLHDSIDPAVRCGELVRRGQLLAKAGSTGYSTGTHLHFQVGELRPDMSGVCECGADGKGCAADAMTWNDFIANTAHPTVPIVMDDWPASAKCSDRAYEVDLVSQNADAKEPIYVIDDADADHFAFTEGAGTLRKGGAYHGNFHSAKSAPEGAPTTVARYDFGPLVTAPGVFEVLSFVPYNDFADTKKAVHVAIARGTRLSSALAQNVIGGAFHRVPKLGKLKFAGRPGESIVVQNDSGETDHQVGFDAVLLHWVGPAGTKQTGDACEDATECDGALVCTEGACAAGCDDAPCPCGQTCDATGLCIDDPDADCGAAGGGGSGGARREPGIGGGGGASTGAASGADARAADDSSAECGARPGHGELPRASWAATVGLALLAARRRRRRPSSQPQ